MVRGGPHPFALVSYIPDPLGAFLDDLRLKLAPKCKPHAHITILPPRPICAEPHIAIQEIRSLAADCHVPLLGDCRSGTKSARMS